MNLKGKNLLSCQDWHIEELTQVLNLAKAMKQDKTKMKWRSHLEGKSFLMFFYNASLRTHISFETAAFQLGAHPHYRTPNMGWLKKGNHGSGESIKDAAKVISRYVDGLGVRITLDEVPYYGAGHEIIREYANFSTVPVINMADDRFHPCQALSDVMGWAERISKDEPSEMNLSALKGKNLLLTWASSGLARPWSSVQSHLLLASRFGMNITLARPDGYDLDPEVYEWTKQNVQSNGKNFRVINDPDSGYSDAHVVYARNWISDKAYQNNVFQKEKEIEQALTYSNWIVNEQRMARSPDALFANPMPVDRGKEATDGVVDSASSVIYDVAENRLHVQKALLALVMGDKPINSLSNT